MTSNRLLLPAAPLLLVSAPLALQTPFSELRQLAPTRDTGLSSPVALLDANGSPDILALLPGADARAHLNDGTGAFVRVPGAALQGTWDGDTRALAPGQLDDDGLPDLWVGVTPFFGDGTGAFLAGPAPLPSRPAGSKLHVALADHDGDADLDVLFVEQPGPNQPWHVAILENRGAQDFVSGPFLALSGLPTTAREPLSADVDGDLDLDLVFLDAAQPGFHLVRNSGGGAFAAPVSASVFGHFVERAQSSDVDGDGDADLLLCSTTVLGLGVLLNDGSGSFTVDAFVALDPEFDDVVPIDGDGDGDQDLFAYGTEFQFFRNDGSDGFFEINAAVAPVTDEPIASATVFDADGDGDHDILLRRARGNGLRLLLNSGVNRFQDAQSHTPVADYVYAVASGDLDADGSLDLVLGDGTSNTYWRSGGGARFRSRPLTATLPGPPEDIALADVDLDGDLDCFWARLGQSVLLTNALGTLFTDVTASQLPVEDGATRAAAFGDLDGDGTPDLVLGNLETLPGRPNFVTWQNDGSGRFTVSTTRVGRGGSRAVTLGDADGDGDLDAFVGTDLGTDLLLNDGFGGVSAAPPVDWTHVGATADVALGDLDVNGTLDAYLARRSGTSQQGWSSATDQLALGNGAGRFTWRNVNGQPAITYDVELADLDLDGDLDAVAKVWRRQQPGAQPIVEARWNDASGGLDPGAEALATHTLGSSLVLEVGDFDGDLDPDVFADGRVLSNLTRSLAARGAARLGKRLSMDGYGSPNATVVLAVGVATRVRPLGALGTLHLDLDSLLLSLRGPLDATGRGSASFKIPDDPSLLGMTFHWQALIGDPVRLSNLESTTLSNL